MKVSLIALLAAAGLGYAAEQGAQEAQEAQAGQSAQAAQAAQADQAKQGEQGKQAKQYGGLGGIPPGGFGGPVGGAVPPFQAIDPNGGIIQNGWGGGGYPALPPPPPVGYPPILPPPVLPPQPWIPPPALPPPIPNFPPGSPLWPVGSPFAGQGVGPFQNACGNQNNGNIACGNAGDNAGGPIGGLGLGGLLGGPQALNLLSNTCSFGSVGCCQGQGAGGSGLLPSVNLCLPLTL